MIKVRFRTSGPHIKADVFDGPDKDHLALCGTIHFSPKGFQEFCGLLRCGHSAGHLVITETRP